MNRRWKQDQEAPRRKAPGYGARGVCLILLLAAAGCRSTLPPAFQNKEGRPLAEEPALPYCIAIAPLDRSTARPNPSPDDAENGDRKKHGKRLGYTLSDEEFQDLLARKMRELQVSSIVRVVGVRAREEAEAMGADLLITPRLVVAPRIEKEGRLGSRWATLGLWVTTWVGALGVKDTRYSLSTEVEFDIRHLAIPRPLATRKVSTTHADLSFRERNRGEKARWVQTAVIPPFWARSSDKATSRVLSEVMVARVAGWLTRYLKDEFAVVARRALGDLRLTSPRNGAIVDGGGLRLVGEIVASEPITELIVLVNTIDPEQAQVSLVADDLPEPEGDQQRAGQYFVDLGQVLPELMLDDSIRNVVRIRFLIGVEGAWSTRTLVFRSPRGAGTSE